MSDFVANIRSTNNRYLRLAFDGCVVFLGSLFLAFMAQIAVPLSFSPIPLSMQTLGVMLIGASLGSRKGALAIITYLAEGALGFPVFAGGTFGIAKLVSPAGGYLFGFVVTAFIVGFLFEKGWNKKLLTTFLAFFLGSVCTTLFGTLYLSLYVGFPKAFFLGVFPFLIGNLLKIITATCLVRGALRLGKTDFSLSR